MSLESIANSSLSVSPTAGPVGSKINVTGTGFPPDAPLVIEWSSVNASWVITGNPPQVTGTRIVDVLVKLGSAKTDAIGSFTVFLVTPADYGSRSHAIQAFAVNGTAFHPKALYTLEPSFKVSPSSGPAGTPITITASGLGYGLYSTSYHLSWDNRYAGYATALTSRGSTNFTIYASGLPGTHYIDIYQGYPGPGYLNPQQGPPAGETQSWFPPLIPFHAEFNITSSQGSSGFSAFSPPVTISFAAIVAALVLVQQVVSRNRAERKAVVKAISAVLLIAALIVGGLGVLALNEQSSANQTASYAPEASSVRPLITVPPSTASAGPRVSVSPNVVVVGANITVSGAGFAPDTLLSLTWSTRQGNNLFGYQLVNRPLRNVTSAPDGSFSFEMVVPPDLGGIHYISAGNLTRNSNATLFLERSASISSTQGPAGTNIVIKLLGVGWDYNTNIIAADYDNSYVGYACGFSSNGNVTIDITASGSPGLHTVDIYPSIWWGASVPAAQIVAEYRYPLLTPQDHPELMPSFHFTFWVTGTG